MVRDRRDRRSACGSSSRAPAAGDDGEGQHRADAWHRGQQLVELSESSILVVWRWKVRFMAEGVDGLTRDKTRKPGKQPLPATVVQRVVDLTLGPPPGDATHWTGRMLANATCA